MFRSKCFPEALEGSTLEGRTVRSRCAHEGPVMPLQLVPGHRAVCRSLSSVDRPGIQDSSGKTDAMRVTLRLIHDAHVEGEAEKKKRNGYLLSCGSLKLRWPTGLAPCEGVGARASCSKHPTRQRLLVSPRMPLAVWSRLGARVGVRKDREQNKRVRSLVAWPSAAPARFLSDMNESARRSRA